MSDFTKIGTIELDGKTRTIFTGFYPDSPSGYPPQRFISIGDDREGEEDNYDVPSRCIEGIFLMDDWFFFAAYSFDEKFKKALMDTDLFEYVQPHRVGFGEGEIWSVKSLAGEKD